MEPMNLNTDKLEEETGAGPPALILLLSAQLVLSIHLVSVSLSCPISLLHTTGPGCLLVPNWLTCYSSNPLRLTEFCWLQFQTAGSRRATAQVGLGVHP